MKRKSYTILPHTGKKRKKAGCKLGNRRPDRRGFSYKRESKWRGLHGGGKKAVYWKGGAEKNEKGSLSRRELNADNKEL